MLCILKYGILQKNRAKLQKKNDIFLFFQKKIVILRIEMVFSVKEPSFFDI